MPSPKSIIGNRARWRVAKAAPESFRQQFPEHSRTITQLLYNRGLTSDAVAGVFLNPIYTRDLHHPRLLGGIDQAVGVIEQSIKAGERIVIHGDYDADGLTASAVLYDVLQRLNANVGTFIPDRIKDGYGVTEATLRRLRQEGVDLVITVDCGISDAGAISVGRQVGLKVIVTDHHHPPATLPTAEAVVNPNLPGDNYPNKALTGVGVAFKLAQAVLRNSNLPERTQEAAEKWLLDLVAIGTVADMASLTGENRTLVKYGLVVLAQTRRLGVAALMSAAQVNLERLDTSSIGFAIAPRLNAAGRLSNASSTLELLTTTDPERAHALASELDQINRQRQDVTAQAVLEARGQVHELTDDDRVLILEGDSPAGIVGLVAGRLAQQYHRPALVIERGETVSKGSARSIAALNIVEALAANKRYLTTYGGHAGAAGFSLPTAKLAEFKAALEKYCAERLAPEDLRLEINIESTLDPGEFSFELVEALALFQPFGIDNAKPLLLLEKVELQDVAIVGREQTHLRLKLALPNGIPVTALAFGMADSAPWLRSQTVLDLVGTPVTSVFNQTKQLEWHVSDFRAA